MTRHAKIGIFLSFFGNFYLRFGEKKTVLALGIGADIRPQNWPRKIPEGMLVLTFFHICSLLDNLAMIILKNLMYIKNT